MKYKCSFLIKTLVLFTLFPFFICEAQTQFVVKDSQSLKPVAKASIYFNDGNLIYSSENGEVYISEEFQIQDIDIERHGYQLKKIRINDINDGVILLDPIDLILPEVKLGRIDNEKKFRHKPSRKRSWMDGAAHYHGYEYGLFITNPDPKTNLQLTEITIPVISKAADWKRAEKDHRELVKRGLDGKRGVTIHKLKNKFTYLYEINFYHMESDTIFNRLSIEPVYQIVTEKDNLYDIDLSEQRIFADEKGILVGVKNMGPCDPDGNLLGTPRYSPDKIVLPNGKEGRRLSNRETMPLIGVTNKRKDNSKSFLNYHLGDSSQFIDLSINAAPMASDDNRQLGIGYRYKLITYK